MLLSADALLRHHHHMQSSNGRVVSSSSSSSSAAAAATTAGRARGDHGGRSMTVAVVTRTSHVDASRREKHYWVNPRDHARRKTKKEIWERFVLVRAPTTNEEGNRQRCEGNGPHEVPQQQPAPPSREWVASMLRRIVEDDCSYFSLATLQKHRDHLENPVDVVFLYEPDGGGAEGKEEEQQSTQRDEPRSRQQHQRRLVAEERLLSMLGPVPFDNLCARLDDRRTVTFYEYAAWINRPRIIGAMLLGGINPCARGGPRLYHTSHQRQSEADDDPVALNDLQRFGRERVVPRFFDGVPLSLSTYVVKRVVELRTSCPSVAVATSSSNDANFSCPLCPPNRRPACILIGFGHDRCSHFCCEPCFWGELIKNLADRRHRDDVVRCPVCDLEKHVDGNRERDDDDSCDDACSLRPSERRQRSLEKFLSLPADAAELKRVASSRRKNVKQLRPALASTWSDAVRPLVGRSKEVRRDRFWRYVEDPRGAYHHYVRGCLEEGVDVFETNQYGQSPLFAAALAGNVRVVRLLLRYHTPNDVRVTGTAHGGVNLASATKAKGHHDIVKILLDYLGTGPDSSARDEVNLISTPSVPLENLRCFSDESCFHQSQFTVLIDPEADLAGAGSYLIDDCLSEGSLEILKALWVVLPEASDVKKKDVPCSTRRYFCDAEGHIQAALVAAMQPFFAEDCVVFPHMRFLCYSEPNTTLLPHVDLPRTDTLSGVRSTHTLLLYLTDCEEGGATCLLDSLNESDRSVIARVRPQRARLFLFPHECPHEGEAVIDVPKLMLRGEARLPQTCRANFMQGRLIN